MRAQPDANKQKSGAGELDPRLPLPRSHMRPDALGYSEIGGRNLQHPLLPGGQKGLEEIEKGPPRQWNGDFGRRCVAWDRVAVDQLEIDRVLHGPLAIGQRHRENALAIFLFVDRTTLACMASASD